MDCCGGILPLPKTGYSPGSEGNILSGAEDWAHSVAYVYSTACVVTMHVCACGIMYSLLPGIDYVSFKRKQTSSKFEFDDYSRAICFHVYHISDNDARHHA